jgi:acyl-CoA synthetase (AMP-forming)/AMP-acid ligase II
MHVGWKLRQLARWYPDSPAIIDEAGPWTYRAFLSRISRFGHVMAGLGLTRGDRIGLIIPDIREYLEADYGTMAAGFVRVPLDPRLTRAETLALLRHAGVRALVIHASFADKAEGLTGDVESLRHVVSIGGTLCGAHEYESLLQRASDAPLAEGDASELAALNFSGGTTGAPKATMLLHRTLMTVAQNTAHAFDVGPESTFLNVRPLWPIAQVILMSYLMGGATVTLGGRFEADSLSELIQRTGARRTSLVPTHLVRWMEQLRPADKRLAGLETIHIGGSRIPPDLFERALETIGPKIGVLYGMTEAPISTYLKPAELDCEPERRRVLIESVGRELFGYQVKIDAKQTGPTIDNDREGEVLIRGGNVMAGYWKNEEATRATLDGDSLRTGDLGRFDEAGNLYIVGRLKDVIRSGSSTILPKEVEDAISSHPAVREVAVLGLADVEWGEAVTAFVVLRPGTSASESEIIEHCRGRLASYKKPRSVRFLDGLPRSHYGKVLQAQLIGQCGAGDVVSG